MTRSSSKGYRGPMIHIRLDKTTHRKLKVRVARKDTTIQRLVVDLICREVGESRHLKKDTPEEK